MLIDTTHHGFQIHHKDTVVGSSNKTHQRALAAKDTSNETEGTMQAIISHQLGGGWSGHNMNQ